MAKAPNFPLDPSQFPQERDLVRYTSVHRSVPEADADALGGEGLKGRISHETHPESIDSTSSSSHIYRISIDIQSAYISNFFFEKDPLLQHPTFDIAKLQRTRGVLGRCFPLGMWQKRTLARRLLELWGRQMLQRARCKWWLTHPSEKYKSQLGSLFPIYGKTKNVPNHPERHFLIRKACTWTPGATQSGSFRTTHHATASRRNKILGVHCSIFVEEICRYIIND